MKTVYVIAVKRLYDCEGNILNRWEYVSGAGYTFWDKSVDGALHLKVNMVISKQIIFQSLRF